MTRLSVPDMSCGHCKATVERAIASVAPGAKVSVDLETRTVMVEGAEIASVLKGLDAEGYPAEILAA